MIVAMAPCARTRRMSKSRSGCSVGSPPLKVMMLVPSAPSLSIRCTISEVGPGCESLSNSLQYVHARLQRRVGMIWAKIGWSGDTIARTNILASRQRRLNFDNVLMFGQGERPGLYLSLYGKLKDSG